MEFVEIVVTKNILLKYKNFSKGFDVFFTENYQDLYYNANTLIDCDVES